MEPTPYDMSNPADMARWFEEMEDYLQVDDFLRNGTDRLGRKYAWAAFFELKSLTIRNCTGKLTPAETIRDWKEIALKLMRALKSESGELTMTIGQTDPTWMDYVFKKLIPEIERRIAALEGQLEGT